MKASTVLDKMDEIEKKWPTAQLRWNQLRRLLMAVAQAEGQLTPVAGDGAIAPHVCETCRHGQCPDMCASCNPPAPKPSR